MTGAQRFALYFLSGWPLPLLHALGALLGVLLWCVPNKLKRLTVQHMAVCFPEWTPQQRRRVAFRSLIHSMCAAAESPAMWFGSEWRVRRWLHQPAAADALQRLRAENRGAIFLTPHWGSWELSGLFASTQWPLTALYKPQKGIYDGLIHRGRSRLGATLVPTSATGVKALMRALQRREAVGLLPDHDPPEGSGEFANFFGVSAHTTPLVTKLAARTGAPVWFVLSRRRWMRGFEITVVAAPAAVADPVHGVSALNRALEDIVRRAPEQYWWGYARYRRRPPGEPSPYAR